MDPDVFEEHRRRIMVSERGMTCPLTSMPNAELSYSSTVRPRGRSSSYNALRIVCHQEGEVEVHGTFLTDMCARRFAVVMVLSWLR